MCQGDDILRPLKLSDVAARVANAARRRCEPRCPERLRALRPALALGCLVVMCVTSPLAAQSDGEATEPSSERAVFLPSYDYHLNFQWLAIDDIRFTWQADFGGEVGLVDYGAGQVTVSANFETILGGELRAFDPNQDSYTLEVSASMGLGPYELVGVFHHVSRHLSDRSKAFAIEWNMAGLQLFRSTDVGRLHLDGSGRAYFTTQRSLVDYRGEFGGTLAGRYERSAHVAAIASGSVIVRTVDPSVFQRDTRVGGRGEVGIRLTGGAGALEFFVAREARIDADPLDLTTRSWTSIGFRLLSK